MQTEDNGVPSGGPDGLRAAPYVFVTREELHGPSDADPVGAGPASEAQPTGASGAGTPGDDPDGGPPTLIEPAPEPAPAAASDGDPLRLSVWEDRPEPPPATLGTEDLFGADER